MTLTVHVIAPNKTIWDDQAEEVILPSTTGQLGILSGHAPLMSALGTGVMRVRANQKWIPIALMDGFAEIDEDEITILVNDGERGEDIDLEEARKLFQDAEAEMDKVSDSTPSQDVMKIEQALKRARARFQAADALK